MSAFALVLNTALFGCFACQKEKEKKCDALLTAGTVFSTPAALTLAAIRCYAAAMDTLLSATCYTHTHTHTHTQSREGKTNTQRDEKYKNKPFKTIKVEVRHQFNTHEHIYFCSHRNHGSTDTSSDSPFSPPAYKVFYRWSWGVNKRTSILTMEK